MDTQISKVLAQGIADGDSPAAIARKLNKVIGGGLDLTTKTKAGIQRTIPAQVRARTLARTEVIRAHHAATIQEYRNFGLAGVKVQAEWSTAGFNVCDKCASLEGKIYTLDEIEGLLPFHPNCRCIALPTILQAF
jgi:SPP1 gp7 family putative phage head morphogenesis protein